MFDPPPGKIAYHVVPTSLPAQLVPLVTLRPMRFLPAS